MSKMYVPKTLSEFMSESKVITLKRKYTSERPAVVVGTNAPLRNQVLSYVAESGTVNKRDLKAFILGLKEGGSANVAAANMFIKRNAKYFISENKNGVTYYKLSNLGQRLVNQFVPVKDNNVSESLNERQYLTEAFKLYEKKQADKKDELSDEDLEKINLENDDNEGELDTLDSNIDNDELSDDDLENFRDDDSEGEGDGEDAELEDAELEDAKVGGLVLSNDDMPAEEIDFGVDDEEVEKPEFVAPKTTGVKPIMPKTQLSGQKETSNPYKSRLEEIVEIAKNLYKSFSGDDLPDWIQDKIVKAKIHLQDIEEYMHSQEEANEGFGNEMDDEENHDNEMSGDSRSFDFKDKGRPGLLDADDSVTESLSPLRKKRMQQIIENLRAKSIPRLNEAKVTLELYVNTKGDQIVPGDNEEEYLLDRLSDEGIEHRVVYNGNLKGNELSVIEFTGDKQNIIDLVNDIALTGDPEEDDEILQSITESLNEAEETTKEDELTDTDVEQTDDQTDGDINLDDTDNTEGDENIEKVEITEFIITVDNADEAIEELEKLGVTAERVPVEAPKDEEIPVDTDTDINMDEKPADEGGDDIDLNMDSTTDAATAAKESLLAFLNDTYLNEAEDAGADAAIEGGNSDEISLGDQGEDAKELTDASTGNVEPTAEFEENKIKVKAEDWEILKGWLEEKGVDVKEMFGGDIETEEIDPDMEASEIGNEGSSEEISDEEIDFSGIGDDDKTKVKKETNKK